MTDERPILNYGRIDQVPTPAPTRVELWTAYVLIVSPFIYGMLVDHPDPPPISTVVGQTCFIAVAIGASLFVVRRRRRNVFGWLGLVLWGGILLVVLVAVASH
jgi:hypothetical protein